MRKLIAVAILAGSALSTTPASAQITYYTDYAAFIAALYGVPFVEDFEDNSLVPGLTFVSTMGNIADGVFNDQLAPAAQTTTFSFGGPITAFGGFWDLSPGGPGVGISFNPAPGSTLTMEVPISYTGEFWGFTSVSSFSSLLLTGGTQSSCCVETYTLDNLTFGQAVPEPAAWGMMIGGFALAGAALRRRQVRTSVSFA
jgi:PEP-CTERM motif